MDNLTITLGTLNFNMTATPGHSIKGNVSIASGQTLNFNPAAPGTVNFNGTSPQTIGGPGALTFAANQTVNINNANGVSLLKDATLNGTLTLTNGDLNTGTNTLTMPATATSGPAVGATDVVGNVMRTGFVSGGAALSFGNPNNQIQINSGTAPTDITVNLLKQPPPDFANAVRRTYTITVNGGSSIVATVRFHYRNSEANGNPENGITTWRKAGPWVDQGKSSNFDDGVGEDNWVERDTVSTFSPWTLAAGIPTAAPANISGRITTSSGTPLGGVTMRLSGGRSAKTITDSDGNYRFTNVDTNNFYTVTPSLVNYQFGPESRSFSLLANMTDAVFTATRDSVSSGNAIDSADYFVRQHYLDFLGREPDDSGFNFWSDQMLQCGTDAGCLERRRINVSAAYFLSIEFQQTGGLVDGLYRASYGRRPLFAEFMPDTAIVARGVVVGSAGWPELLAANKQAFVNAWVQRAEFRAAYDGLANAGYVDRVISHTGVIFSQSERDALVSGLNSGSSTRAGVLRQIAENQTLRECQT